VYDPKNKAEALVIYFYSVHLQASNLTSAAVNDLYNFFNLYITLNIVKHLPNNKEVGYGY